MQIARLATASILLIALVSCNQAQESCRMVQPGMRLSEVADIMGEPKASHLVGDPPVGLMLIYGDRNLDKPGFSKHGPVAIEMLDAPSGHPADRTVGITYCRNR
jgi:hypothetical protein